MAGPRLVESFSSWARKHPDLEPDVVPTIVDLKAKRLGDGQPGRWRNGDLTSLLLEILPRTVVADEQWYVAVVPTMRAFLTYADRNSQLHRASSRLDDLLAELDAVAPAFDDAMQNPERTALLHAIMEEAGREGPGQSRQARLEFLVARLKGLSGPDDEDGGAERLHGLDEGVSAFDGEFDDEFDDADDDDWKGPRRFPPSVSAPMPILSRPRAPALCSPSWIGSSPGSPAATPPRMRWRRTTSGRGGSGLLPLDSA
jgi:hypothetical protein